MVGVVFLRLKRSKSTAPDIGRKMDPAQSGGTFGCRSFFIFMSETKGGLLIKKMKLEIKDRNICRFFVR